MKKFFLLSMLALCFVGLTHANLLSNGDFTYGVGGVTGDEMAAMDWTNWNSSPTGWNNRETNANGPYGDTANYHIAIGNAGGYGAGAYQDVSGAAGKTYIFSADASLDAWWKNAGYLKLEFYDGLGTDPENMVGFFESDHFQQPGYDTGLPWANYTIQATAPAGTAVVRAILGTWGEGGTARFDNAVLDLATKASSPVPGNGDVAPPPES